MKTKYSHAFFVGDFNANITPQQLDGKWEKVNNSNDYTWLCSMYYQGHVDAMLDGNEKRPAFLKDVCHYIHTYKTPDEKGNNILGVPISLIGMGKEEFTYNFRLLNLHLNFFPLGIVLVGIEIDDTGTDLNELTAAHSAMVITNTYKRPELKSALSSLLELLSSDDVSLILGIGNKFKLYQIIQIESDDIPNPLLYEVGTSSPVGCVGTKHQLAPSKSYFDDIIDNNVVSAFNNWKGLSLMDSFTMISNATKREDWTWDQHFHLWNSHYFQLIYLRCLFEKTFCSSRNTNYRMTDKSQNISEEIKNMERYYFYDKISHNFLPNLLYKSMAIGLELKEERAELSNQVKERSKEEEEKRQNRITLGLSVFAVFSVAWDFCSIFMQAFTGNTESWPAQSLFTLSIVAITILAFYIYRKKR